MTIIKSVTNYSLNDLKYFPPLTYSVPTMNYIFSAVTNPITIKLFDNYPTVPFIFLKGTLSQKGVLQNKNVDAYCYVPYRLTIQPSYLYDHDNTSCVGYIELYSQPCLMYNGRLHTIHTVTE